MNNFPHILHIAILGYALSVCFVLTFYISYISLIGQFNMD